MNTKENQRTRLSKILIKNALTELMSEGRSVEKISVKELCEKAELNRSTFYSHYSEPDDVLREIEDDLIASTRDYLKKIGSEEDPGAVRYIAAFLQHIRDNDKVFRSLLLNSCDPRFMTEFMQQSIFQYIENLEIIFPEKNEQFIYAYILNGSTGIITQWMRSGYEENVNELASVLFSLNRNALTDIAE